MSQPANDEFSQHLSDDEASNHEDASDTGAAPKQQQQAIPQTTAISNIKLPILKKEEYDIWAMEMEHYLEYIDNEVWKVIQNGNSKKRISTGKDGIVRSGASRFNTGKQHVNSGSVHVNSGTQIKSGGSRFNTGKQNFNSGRVHVNTARVPAKQDVAEQGTKKRKGGHMKMIARKRKRPQPDVDSDDEHRKCLKIVTFEGTIDSEIMERKSFISKLDKVSSPEGDYLVVYRVNGNFRAFNYLMEVLHIFDRQDLFHLYDLVMKQYSESTPEGIELILWGDLKIMMESSIEVTDQGDFWNDQQDWEIVTWRLYEACGVCILEFKDGTVIHMLVERKYPLSKELLQRMLDFGLEVEVESTAALDLIRVLNSPCFMVKSWLVQDQTVLGKDYSNLLIADSLLKTIWFINAPCYGNEALASPKANGKDSKRCQRNFKIRSRFVRVFEYILHGVQGIYTEET
ncbi:hypothetical protein Tco_0446879 [Tanacetum coccineum]